MGVCPTCGKPIYQLAKKARVNQPRRKAVNKGAVKRSYRKNQQGHAEPPVSVEAPEEPRPWGGTIIWQHPDDDVGC